MHRVKDELCLFAPLPIAISRKDAWNSGKGLTCEMKMFMEVMSVVW